MNNILLSTNIFLQQKNYSAVIAGSFGSKFYCGYWQPRVVNEPCVAVREALTTTVTKVIDQHTPWWI
jgi:hypothetical protein